ncbi:unnamed protein product, partial [Heterosigma akashiwo]
AAAAAAAGAPGDQVPLGGLPLRAAAARRAAADGHQLPPALHQGGRPLLRARGRRRAGLAGELRHPGVVPPGAPVRCCGGQRARPRGRGHVRPHGLRGGDCYVRGQQGRRG